MNARNHNLDEQTAEYFEFTLRGFTYRMVYPSTQELLDVSDLAEKSQELRKQLENDPTNESLKEQLAKESKDEMKFLDWLQSKTTAITPDAPALRELILQGNIRQSLAFYNMIGAEFGDTA